MNRNSKKPSGAASSRRAASSPNAGQPQLTSTTDNRAPSDKSKTPRKRRPRFVL